MDLRVDDDLADPERSLDDQLLLHRDVSLLDQSHLLGPLFRELVVQSQLQGGLVLLSAGLESLGDDAVVSLDDFLVVGDNVSVELGLLNLASEGLLVVGL